MERHKHLYQLDGTSLLCTLLFLLILVQSPIAAASFQKLLHPAFAKSATALPPTGGCMVLQPLTDLPAAQARDRPPADRCSCREGQRDRCLPAAAAGPAWLAAQQASASAEAAAAA